MNKEENRKISLEIKSSDGGFKWESDHWDAGADEYCQAFFAAMIGTTFMPATVLTAMRDFAENMLPLCGGE